MQDNSTANAMSMMDLISLKNILDEYELPTAILEKSDVLPLNSLIVNPTNDYKGRTRTLSFSFLPLEDEHFPDVKLMQIFSEFNFEITPKMLPTMERLILKLSKLLALGSLGISDNNKVYFRYVHTIGKYANLSEQEDIIANLFNLFIYGLNVNARVLEEVAIGEKTLEAAYEAFVNH